MITVPQIETERWFAGRIAGRGADAVQPFQFGQFVIHTLQFVDPSLQVVRHFAQFLNGAHVLHEYALLQWHWFQSQFSE